MAQIIFHGGQAIIDNIKDNFLLKRAEKAVIIWNRFHGVSFSNAFPKIMPQHNLLLSMQLVGDGKKRSGNYMN